MSDFKAAFGHWHSIAFNTGLRCDSVVAPVLLGGAMNGELFLAHVTQFLVATLSAGDIVIADNLSCHKVAGALEAIELEMLWRGTVFEG